MDGKTSLCVVNEPEVLARLVDRNHVHEARWICGVGAYFAVNFNEALHKDSFGFAGVEGIFKAVLMGKFSMPVISDFSKGSG